MALEHTDPCYIYYIGAVRLCFSFQYDDQTHECIFVEYVWPDDKHSAKLEDDGVSLQTIYHFAPSPRSECFEVRPVAQLLFVVSLVTPPTLREPSPHARTRYIINDDIYGIF